MKSLKLKKLITLGLIGALMGVNSIKVFAGTNRNFWDMTIYYNKVNYLQSRAKETDLPYSWAKITSASSNLSSVKLAIWGGGIPGAYNFSCSSMVSFPNLNNSGKTGLNVWRKLSYDQYKMTKPGHVYLVGTNANFTLKTGTISGVVDYE